jgi:hypothetical protein
MPDDAMTGDLDLNEAADEFLKRFVPPDAPKEPSKESEEKTPKDKGAEDETAETETPDADDAEEPSDAEEEEGSDEEAAEKKYAEDEVYTKIKVGDEEHEVPIKDLKRLWGQEAALTNKSKEVADTRKKLDDTLAQNLAASNAMLERAKSRLEPYTKVDFLLASKELTTDEYTNLRNEAQAAYDEVNFLESHVGNFMEHVRSQQQSNLIERAKTSLKELQDPEKGIPGFTEKVYDDIRSFAVSNGAPQDVVNNLVDAWAIKLIHDAMQFRKGQSGKVITQKVNKTPKKIVKSSTTPEAVRAARATDSDKAFTRLQRSGTVDDAADVFLSRIKQLDD